MAIQGLDYRNTTVIHAERMQAIKTREGQLAALHAPANRSQLGQLHFQIMLSIGRKAFDDATLCPVDPVEYATPEGYTNAAWAYAMYKMRHFYKTTVARKEVNFNATR